MENEIMNYEEEVTYPMDETYDMETESSGLGTGAAMLIGAGLTLATTAAIKLGKNLYAKYKAKKELRKPEEGKAVEVTDEDVMSVAK